MITISLFCNISLIYKARAAWHLRVSYCAQGVNTWVRTQISMMNMFLKGLWDHCWRLRNVLVTFMTLNFQLSHIMLLHSIQSHPSQASTVLEGINALSLFHKFFWFSYDGSAQLHCSNANAKFKCILNCKHMIYEQCKSHSLNVMKASLYAIYISCAKMMINKCPLCIWQGSADKESAVTGSNNGPLKRYCTFALRVAIQHPVYWCDRVKCTACALLSFACITCMCMATPLYVCMCCTPHLCLLWVLHLSYSVGLIITVGGSKHQPRAMP